MGGDADGKFLDMVTLDTKLSGLGDDLGSEGRMCKWVIIA